MKKLFLFAFMFTFILNHSLNAQVGNRKIQTITIKAINNTYHKDDQFDFDLWRNDLNPRLKEEIKPVLEKWARNFIAKKTKAELNAFLSKTREKRSFNYIEEVMFNKIFCKREFEQTGEPKFLISAPEIKLKNNKWSTRNPPNPMSFENFINKNLEEAKALRENQFHLSREYGDTNPQFSSNALELIFDVLQITDNAKFIKTILICEDDIMTEIPENIRYCYNTENLVLYDNKKLRRLPTNIGSLKELNDIQISKCQNLEGLPDSICYLKKITYLALNDIRTLPKDFPFLVNSLPNYNLSLRSFKLKS